MFSTLSTSDILSIAAAGLVVLGVAPILKSGHKAQINLSVWAVITANAWLAAGGNLFADQKGASAVYMILSAAILSPVLFFNLKSGVWGNLPPWHRAAAFVLPVGTGLGIFLGGEFATWTSVFVSLLLSVQLVESCWNRISREHLTTWTWFFLADGSALLFGWGSANVSLRSLLSVWVIQCVLVISIEVRNRRSMRPLIRSRDTSPFQKTKHPIFWPQIPMDQRHSFQLRQRGKSHCFDLHPCGDARLDGVPQAATGSVAVGSLVPRK